MALCDDKVAHMVPLPPAEPPTINAYMTIQRVTVLQNQESENNSHGRQPQWNGTLLVNQPPEWSHQSQHMHPHDHSMVILQQFSIITQELQNFTYNVSSDLHKVTQVCTTAQENISRLVQDAISQALANPQESTSTGANSSREPRIFIFTLNQVPNSSNDAHFTASWQMNDFGVAQHLDWEAYHSQVLQEMAKWPHTHVNQ